MVSEAVFVKFVLLLLVFAVPVPLNLRLGGLRFARHLTRLVLFSMTLVRVAVRWRRWLATVATVGPTRVAIKGRW